MKATRREYVTREDILKMLTDQEINQISRAETVKSLADGDEYLDLEHLAQGVRRARGTDTPTGQLLPKKAVQSATWNRLLARLLPPGGAVARH